MSKYKKAIEDLLGKDWKPTDDDERLYISKVEIGKWASQHLTAIISALCITAENEKEKPCKD